jgi:DNA-binding CsgD family transcriptional regulator
VTLTDVIEAYERQRWPEGKIPGGKGLTLVCNLYSLNKKRDMLASFFRVSHNRTVACDPLSAIFPGDVAPVVRQTADGYREIDILRLLGEGNTYTQIAAAMGVSYKTIANSTSVIKEKLAFETTADLIRLSVESRKK